LVDDILFSIAQSFLQFSISRKLLMQGDAFCIRCALIASEKVIETAMAKKIIEAIVIAVFMLRKIFPV